jgi:CRP-like cAMP-binding protein
MCIPVIMQIKQTVVGPELLASGEPEVVLPGERTNCEGKPIGNRILLSLPDAEFQSLRPLFSYHHLPRHTTLYEGGERIQFVHFPNQGMVSLVATTREGKSVEVGIVGNEGLIGTPAIVGLNRSPHQAVVQLAGDGFRIRVDALLSALPSSPQLQLIASRHAVLLGIQAAQAAACNRLHGIEKRLARWLLMMQDRVDDPSLYITHDFLSTMLGTDRPSVTLAAGFLQRKGTIEYGRGAVRIVNRKKLEKLTCECYAVIQQFNGPLGLR